eukprot:gene32319-16890_t
MATEAPSSQLVVHHGSCHCEAIQFEFDAPTTVTAWDCNCSIFSMKRNTHIIVPAARFRLTHGKEEVTTYQFGSCTAKHMFCRICGVQAFYIPRSNPDGYAVNVHCVRVGTLKEAIVKPYDGLNWEASLSTTGIAEESQGV